MLLIIVLGVIGYAWYSMYNHGMTDGLSISLALILSIGLVIVVMNGDFTQVE